jgi:hypothetical protein
MYWLLTGNVLSPSGLLMCPFADMAWWRGNGQSFAGPPHQGSLASYLCL